MTISEGLQELPLFFEGDCTFEGRPFTLGNIERAMPLACSILEFPDDRSEDRITPKPDAKKSRVKVDPIDPVFPIEYDIEKESE